MNEMIRNGLSKKNRIDEKNLTKELPQSTLEKIDEIRLELLKITPYNWRDALDQRQFLELILEWLAADYRESQGRCKIIEEIKQILADLPADNE